VALRLAPNGLLDDVRLNPVYSISNLVAGSNLHEVFRRTASIALERFPGGRRRACPDNQLVDRFNSSEGIEGPPALPAVGATLVVARLHTASGRNRATARIAPTHLTSLIGHGFFHCVMNDICLKKWFSDDVESQLLIERDSMFLSFEKEAKTIRAFVQCVRHHVLHKRASDIAATPASQNRNALYFDDAGPVTPPTRGRARPIVVEAEDMTTIVLVFVNLQSDIDVEFDFESQRPD
jgi:hypothetical protein